MVHAINKSEISRSEIRMHHIAETLPKLGEGSCIQISKKYIVHVTCNQFFFQFSKGNENKRRFVELSVTVLHTGMEISGFLRGGGVTPQMA